MPALLGVGVITLSRVILLAFNQTDLFVDEAQYWLWGQELAFGYYSKPPMIGWVIRAATEIGTNAPFWVRLPAPLFHAATALILGAIAARVAGQGAAILVALGFVTLPMVAVGSLLVSTDTIMFPFLAASLFFYLRLLKDPGTGSAILAGAMLGLAFLSKYAAAYFILCAALAAPVARPRLIDALALFVAFGITISPNLIWNLQNGLSTLQHTLDNADWVRDPSARAGLNVAGLGEFFGAQFAVFGPVLFGGLLMMAGRWCRLDQSHRVLILFSLPIVAIVCGQALLSGAYANWAAAAYLAGSLAVLPWLTRAWLVASFLVNGTLCLLFPLAATAPEFLTREGQPLLSRYIGRVEMSAAILETADAEGLSTIVASDRDVLADLFYTGRDRTALVYALPPINRAPHHYALRFPYPGRSETLLLVMRAQEEPPCAAQLVKRIEPATGAYRLHPMALYRAPGDCF